MTLDEKVKAVKDKVTVADYFDEIIIPDMSWYYSDGYTADLNIREVIKCPFHTEDTPSFRYYPETNSYYCWGCAKGGDIIKLHREFMSDKGEDLSFSEAVSFLFDVFIKGKISTGQTIKRKKKEVEIENNNVDILRFKMKIAEIETILQRIDKISKENKYILYKLMDDLDRLILLNMVDAKKALKEVNRVFNEINKKKD